MGCMFGSDYLHLISQEISITLQRTHGRKSPEQHSLGVCRHHKDCVRTSSESGLQGSLQICLMEMLPWLPNLSGKSAHHHQLCCIGGWQALCPLLTSVMCTLHETPWLLPPCKN